ncbi:hypothetical protein K0810_06330 [Erysipelothrix rhusiopathiae]|uniref:hypothetical protein n=1 Tax=Erysipelothrix rhusiopathiae TaxID=1648 RepID=UPI000210B59C|nr:hypothetical protein [Erysipelothrix rhusiopathiae]AGN24529.1 hypothetical protein K210_04630 [Erysipelothrix rhusiopathiae SY1027]AMS10668.1 hypothetical protein A2I91_02480 [Erysipelothrix rhusiopathiae]AOO66990.1 hypothetical protein BC346_01235 [Erysipelothrix rhusiopathiae]AWU41974.1 hypothetical protein DM789_07050 [Erysipelothrix rhusiopathiae]MDE8282865.1 hypothetical protein [Erysipelothrix rhusiopathiae]
MRNITSTLESYTSLSHFELLEVSRRKQYIGGEATDTFDTVYKALINYEPTEIRVEDDGKIMQDASKVISYVQAGTPLKVSFEDCLITISPKSQYELGIRGVASKATITVPK